MTSRDDTATYPDPANTTVRLLAFSIDYLLFLPPSLLIGQVLPVGDLDVYGREFIASSAILVVLWLIYRPTMESTYGATLGKIVCGLRVINGKGGDVPLSKAFLRQIPLVLVYVILIAGLIVMDSATQSSQFFLLLLGVLDLMLVDNLAIPMTHRGQALHNLLAGTYCVSKESL